MTRQEHVHWAPLDGLRAVAVLVVVAFHLGIGWAGGGFLGVDLFFVISGFLITWLLVAERDRNGRIDVRGFWSRRVRRLVPAAVAMIAVTTLATRLWMVEEMWSAVRRDAFASLAWVANWRYIADGTDYFDRLLGPSPLEHTWSLAVEEQFYLLWPLLLVGLLSRWLHRRRAVLVGLSAAALTSSWWMAQLYDPAAPDRAYQGTDTRAQQLLVGAILAWIVLNWPTGRFVAVLRHRSVVWSAAVLFAVAVIGAGPSSGWLFDGGFLVVSLAGAVLVASCAVPRGGALGLLSAAPLVAIGRRSYGLYLWHWPVIVFVGSPMGIDLPRWPLIALQLVVAALLTEASFRLVEFPAQRTRLPRRVVAGWVGAGALCAAGGLVVLAPPGDRAIAGQDVVRPSALSDGDDRPTTIAAIAPADRPTSSGTMIGPPAPTSTEPPSPLPTPSPTPAPTRAPSSARATGAGTPDVTAGTPDIAVGTDESGVPPEAAGAPAPTTPRRVLLVGDSTALTLIEALWFQGEAPWDIEAQARNGCHVTDGVPIASAPPHPPPLPDECRRWRDDWAESVRATDPELVIVSIGPWEMLDHRAGDVDVRFPTPEWRAHVRRGLTDMLSIVGAPGRSVVLLRVPCIFDDHETTRDRNDPARVAAFNELLEEAAADDADVYTAPLDDVLCPQPDPAGIATDTDVRYDGLHVTPTGGALVWEWLFEDPWLDRPRPS